MSRILQALKQIEARPGEVPVPAASPPVAATVADIEIAPPAVVTPIVAETVPASIEPPAVQRQVTERVTPRRKPQSPRRAEVAPPPAPEPAAVATAEEVEQLLASLSPGVIECWSARTEVDALVLPTATDIAATPAQAHLVVQDFAPQITVPAPIATPVETPAASEFDLEFSMVQPRRAVVVEGPPQPSPQQRETLEAREQQVRTAVRGPRNDTVARACAWETNVHADLADPLLAQPFEALVERWRQDRGASEPGTLLVASLAQPMVACEVALRAATLLARREDRAVLIIDGDLEGALSRRLAIIGKPGLTELLVPQDAHGETIHATATPRLHVLPRGRSDWPVAATPDTVLRLLTELGHEYAWLIIVAGEAPSPSVTAVARACAATYAVTPLGSSDLAVAQERLAALQAAGARILGAIATQ